MTTETAPAPTTETTPPVEPDSTAGTSSSTDSPVAPPIEETPPAVTGEETPGTEEEKPAAPALTPEQRLAELDTKAESDGLTADEAKELKSVRQSVTARQANYQQRVTAAKDVASRVETAATQAHATLETNLQWIEEQNDGTAASVELAKERRQRALADFKAVGDVIHQYPVHRDIGDRLVGLMGESAELREWLNRPDVSWEAKLNHYENQLIAKARMLGVDDAHVVLPKTGKGSLEEIKKDAGKAAVDEYKAKNGIGAASKTDGGLPAAGTLTYSRYMAMSAEQRREVSPAEEARITKEEMNRRTAR